MGHLQFGKLMRCPDQYHLKDRREYYYRLSGLKEHEHYRLTDIDHLDDVSAELHQLIGGFVRDPRGWLYIWGGPGNGKSLALMATVSEFVQRGNPALYLTLFDLLDIMRETFGNKPRGYRDDTDAWRKWDTYHARFERVQRVKLLAIDEFDGSKINETSWMREFRGRLIDHRYRDGVGGETYTLLAGNDDPATLPYWIHDRAQDSRFQIWENRGESVRGEMEW